MTKILTQEDFERIAAWKSAASATRKTLEQRVAYGGRKGRRATQRLEKAARKKEEKKR